MEFSKRPYATNRQKNKNKNHIIIKPVAILPFYSEFNIRLRAVLFFTHNLCLTSIPFCVNNCGTHLYNMSTYIYKYFLCGTNAY